MTSPNKVYQLGHDDFLDKSHKKLLNQISVLDWEMQVIQIIKSLSLPLSELLLDKETQPAPNSHALKCGHETVEEFVTSDSSNLGLGMDWNEWETKVKAYSYKKTFNIYTDDPVEIIQEFKDVTSFLGYKPSCSEEYLEAKDKIFKAQRSQQDKMHSLQVQEMQENINDLIRQVDQNGSLLSEANQKIESLNNQLETAKTEYDKQISTALDNHKVDLANQLQKQREEMTSDLQAKISKIESEADLVKAQSAAEVERIREKYNSDNYISKVEFNALEQELQRERDNSRQDLIKLNQLNVELQDLQGQLSEKEQIIVQLEKQIESQASEILMLTTKIEKGEIAGADITFEDYEALQSELGRLEGIASDFRTQNATLVAQEQKLNRSLKIARSNMSKLQKSLKKQKVRNKKQNGIIKNKQVVVSTLTGIVILLLTGLSLSII
ncbi:hypothetical protein [Vibrio harveyi]|uniref:hypothetical protein n=1 Tax=Vibrio harveyi TaxID=669 RepID=UPI003CF2408A